MRKVSAGAYFENYRQSATKEELQEWEALVSVEFPETFEKAKELSTKAYPVWAHAGRASGCQNTEDILAKTNKLQVLLEELYNECGELQIFNSDDSKLSSELKEKRKAIRDKLFQEWKADKRCQFYIDTLYCYCDEQGGSK